MEQKYSEIVKLLNLWDHIHMACDEFWRSMLDGSVDNTITDQICRGMLKKWVGFAKQIYESSEHNNSTGLMVVLKNRIEEAEWMLKDGKDVLHHSILNRQT